MAIELIAIAELGPLKGVFQIPYLSRRITFSYDFSYVALTGRQPTESVFVWKISGDSLERRKSPANLTRNRFLEFLGNTYILMDSEANLWDVKSNKELKWLPPDRGTESPSSSNKSYFDSCMDVDSTGEYLVGAPLYDSQNKFDKIGVWKIQKDKKGDGGRFEFHKRLNTPAVQNNVAVVRFGPKEEKWLTYAAQLKTDDKSLDVTTWNVESGEQILNSFVVSVNVDDFIFDISSDGKVLRVGEEFYILSEKEAPKPLEIDLKQFQGTDIISKRMLSGNEFGLVSADRKVYLFNISSKKSNELPIKSIARPREGILGKLFSGGEKDLDIDSEEKLKNFTPRVLAISERNQRTPGRYIAAADDQFFLLWKEAP